MIFVNGFFMPFLKLMLRQSRVWLVGLLGVLVFVVGRWVISPEAAVPTVAKGGYWVMLVTVVLFARTLWRLTRESLSNYRPSRADWAALALIVACGGVWVAHERQGFKILADETLLLGTSMGLHYEREVAFPVRATDVQGPFQFPERHLDKRPFFYPFVVSLVHDVTGYRPTNGFHVNAVLGFLFLGLAYVIGWRLGGTRWSGALWVLLFAGLPLLAQQAAGGGFELLNLVMMATFLLLALRYAERPDDLSLEAMCLAAVLLAQTRYESVLFVLPAAVIALWGWWRDGRVFLSWPVVLCPVFLLPYVLQNRVFEMNTGVWEMASRPGYEVPFSLGYVPDNLGHALAFFFDTSGYQGNSIYFSALGLLALPFFALMILRLLRGATAGQPVAVGATGIGLFLIGGLLLAYFWGQFDHPVIRRLSLPLHWLMAMAVATVGAQLIRRTVVWQALCAGAVLALLVQGIPTMARQAYLWDYQPAVEMEWRADFLARQTRRDFLFIDRDVTFWITQRISATPVAQATLRKEGLAYHLRNHSFSAMFVFQRFTVDDQTGALTIDPTDDLGPNFELEPVAQRRIATLHLARISRIGAIRENGEIVARAVLAVPAVEPQLSSAELQKVKAEYLEKWIKQLP